MGDILTFESVANTKDFTFDFSVLQNHSRKEISDWLYEYNAEIRKHLLCRFRFLLDQNPSIIVSAGRIPYLEEAQRVAAAIDFDDYRFQPFAHLIALFGIAPPKASCHEVLFGKTEPVVLSGQILGLLDSFMALSVDSQRRILGDLYAMPSHINNPVHISYLRYRELASSEGYPVTQWLSDFYLSKAYYRQIIGFKEDAILPREQNLGNFKNISNGTSSLWWMGLLVCPALGISADYLFREDYSSLAVRKDRQLTDLEVAFLSAYLSASQLAQRNCRFSLLELNISP